MIQAQSETQEIQCRREQDSPEIDEVVFVELPVESKPTVKEGDFIHVQLKQPMEYDWLGIQVD